MKNIFKKSGTDEKNDQVVSVVSPIEPVAATKIAAVKKTEEKTAKAKPAVSKVNKKTDNDVYKIISKPLITEKATDLTAQNKYCFVVPNGVNKSEMIKAIINLYGIKPIKINFIKRRGKNVRYGHSQGVTKEVKKAIVTLAPTDKIELYEGV
ncbi:MAG: 50S ribosomal protein L23 [Patescibacteria group bacterium]